MNATNLHDEPKAVTPRLPIPSTTTTTVPKYTQERLAWLLDEYHKSASQIPSISPPSSKNLAKNIYELLSRRNLLHGPLSKAAAPVRTLYPEMPREVLCTRVRPCARTYRCARDPLITERE
ncbi:hypothetical protein BDZ89DRAFT_1068299 [Hymenopellis radicata]|nr:hypothetical protein BDZ89DRAFT_1068299 [Hymenopellis radicata]